jgi:hypothetical protein
MIEVELIFQNTHKRRNKVFNEIISGKLVIRNAQVIGKQTGPNSFIRLEALVPENDYRSVMFRIKPLSYEKRELFEKDLFRSLNVLSVNRRVLETLKGASMDSGVKEEIDHSVYREGREVFLETTVKQSIQVGTEECDEEALKKLRWI